MRRDSIYRWLKTHLAPTVTHSQAVYRDAVLLHLKRGPRWLDLGCGHQFAPDWAWVPPPELLAQVPRIVGIDGDFASLRQHQLLRGRVLGDIASLPFADASFDLVTSNMVMEHVVDPDRVLREVRRVLAPNGVFVFHTPNLAYPLVFVASLMPERLKRRIAQFLDEREDEDIYPTAYKINTVRRAAQIGIRAGFQITRCDAVASEALTWTLGPLSAFELLWIRATQLRCLARFRTDIIAVFQAPAPGS